MRKSQAGLSLIEVMVVMAIIALGLAVALPNLSFDYREPTPPLIAYLESQHMEAIESGAAREIWLQDRVLSVHGEIQASYALEAQTDLRVDAPPPSEFLPMQLVTIFYPDGTAVFSTSQLIDKSSPGRDNVLYTIEVNPFDGDVIYYAP